MLKSVTDCALRQTAVIVKPDGVALGEWHEQARKTATNFMFSQKVKEFTGSIWPLASKAVSAKR